MVDRATHAAHWRLEQLRGGGQVARGHPLDAVLLAADSAPAHLARKVVLQRLRDGLLEHVAVLDHRQPERGQGVVVVAAAVSVALDDWRGAELLQAGARRNQVLSVSSGVIRSVLCEEEEEEIGTMVREAIVQEEVLLK